MLKRFAIRACGGAKWAAVFSLLMLVCVVSPARAGTQLAFPRPASLEPNVDFWTDVFTAYSYRDFLIHDRDRVWKVYQVLHMPGSGSPTQNDVTWANAYLKAKYADILERLAAGNEPVGEDERRVAAMFKDEAPDAYAAAAQNLRVQQGLRERFHEAILRRRHYEPLMERVFRTAGLPVELAMLPHVESGYYNSSRSSAGAVGIWQFTRSTGRQYMKISRRRDDRLDPVKSTQAAAKLLQYNYDVLGSWPLAITAYNHGTYGTARAAEAYGNDYSRIFKYYDGPHFGFASRNYYAEFLAALQVHRYEDSYFPGIEDEATPPAQVVRTSLNTGSRRPHAAMSPSRTHHPVKRTSSRRSDQAKQTRLIQPALAKNSKSSH